VDLNWTSIANKDISPPLPTGAGSTSNEQFFAAHQADVVSTPAVDSTRALAAFHIDTLNIQGAIKVMIMEEAFPKSKLIAKVDIPILPMLDCVLSQGDKNCVYERWFPLLLVTSIVLRLP
jgi:hypothetical protein